MKKYDLNEALKKRAAENEGKTVDDKNAEMKLDDVQRVKVLSPARKVFKRFMRNRLAVVGAIILIAMFAFAFLGPLLYPYGQKQVFHKYDELNMKYAQAIENTSYTGYPVDEGFEVPGEVSRQMNSKIKSMLETDADSVSFTVDGLDGTLYTIRSTGHEVYRLESAPAEKVIDSAGVDTVAVGDVLNGNFSLKEDSLKYLLEGDDPDGTREEGLRATLDQLIKETIAEGGDTFSNDGVEFTLKKSKKNYSVMATLDQITYSKGVSPMGDKFEAELKKAIDAGEKDEFGFKAGTYRLIKLDKGEAYSVYKTGESSPAMVYTRYTFDNYENGAQLADDVRVGALQAIGSEDKNFTVGGKEYTLDDEGEYVTIKEKDGRELGEFTVLSIRRMSGKDTVEYELKKTISEKIDEMVSAGQYEGEFSHPIAAQDPETGKVIVDEDGNTVMADTDFKIRRTNTGVFELHCTQITYLIDKFASPSVKHILGTDGDGFDVFARIMYGGRVSLMVGFVVVILETILGVIMGGLAGFYGKWVDMIIMRLVDIFYCIPSLPILIILGVLMDYQRLGPYPRLMVMMAVLGILGWAGIARLVRGQILSLREQEFMVAAEASGLKVRTRIFKHLVPNVMPQLIVSATMGMGGVILTESTLSFLGLGVKHPLATWGTMINSVSSQTAIAEYPYIWIPVGLLICITVVAFNFVGDGLRDAYDPKSKK